MIKYGGKNMETMNRIEIVDKLTEDICKKLGKLISYDVLDILDALDFIKLMSDKQGEWMEKNFSKEEINEFLIKNIR